MAGKLVRNLVQTRGTTVRRACMAQKPYKSEFCKGKSAWMFDMADSNHVMTCCTPCKDLYMKADAEGSSKDQP